MGRFRQLAEGFGFPERCVRTEVVLGNPRIGEPGRRVRPIDREQETGEQRQDEQCVEQANVLVGVEQPETGIEISHRQRAFRKNSSTSTSARFTPALTERTDIVAPVILMMSLLMRIGSCVVLPSY